MLDDFQIAHIQRFTHMRAVWW